VDAQVGQAVHFAGGVPEQYEILSQHMNLGRFAGDILAFFGGVPEIHKHVAYPFY
jgi:hypothetical protein